MKGRLQYLSRCMYGDEIREDPLQMLLNTALGIEYDPIISAEIISPVTCIKYGNERKYQFSVNARSMSDGRYCIVMDVDEDVFVNNEDVFKARGIKEAKVISDKRGPDIQKFKLSLTSDNCDKKQ